jgi:hypothetical protein
VPSLLADTRVITPIENPLPDAAPELIADAMQQPALDELVEHE